MVTKIRAKDRLAPGWAVLLALALAAAAGGCGDAPVDKTEVTLMARPEGSPERRLLTQIYGQALRRAGYEVRMAPRAVVGSAGSYDELKKGNVSGYPEYLSTILFYQFEVGVEDIPQRTSLAYRELEGKLAGQGLVAFPPAPYSIANAVGVLRRSAEEHGLRKNSDLKGKAEKMTIIGPTYCHISVECVGGIERYYNTAFEAISYERARASGLSWWRAEPEYRYKVLENGESDASILYNTDGRLATEGDRFVVLEDDRRIFPASNFVWITSEEVVNEAGPDYEKAIVEAQRGLTLAVVRRLNATLEAGMPPAKVAAEYLNSVGVGHGWKGRRGS